MWRESDQLGMGDNSYAQLCVWDKENAVVATLVSGLLKTKTIVQSQPVSGRSSHSLFDC